MNNPKGFTLVEVLVSSLILTLVLVGVIAVFVQTVEISRRIDYEYTAANLARSRIEFARAVVKTRGFDALTQDAFGEEDTRIDAEGKPASATGEFYRTTTVTADYDGNARLTEVKVRVSYEFQGARTNDSAVLDIIFADI